MQKFQNFEQMSGKASRALPRGLQRQTTRCDAQETPGHLGRGTPRPNLSSGGARAASHSSAQKGRTWGRTMQNRTCRESSDKCKRACRSFMLERNGLQYIGRCSGHSDSEGIDGIAQFRRGFEQGPHMEMTRGSANGSHARRR